MKKLTLKHGDFIALTRKEKDGSLFRSDVGDSQDTWIMLGKPKVLNYCNFYMGVPGCDNLIAYKFFESGYRVLNPSKTINCWHLHDSELRSYSETNRLLDFYLLIKPKGLLGFHFYRVLFFLFNYIKHKFFNIKDFR